MSDRGMKLMSMGCGTGFHLGIMSLTVLGIDAEALWLLARWENPFDALQTPGVFFLIATLACAFLHRLILWRRCSERVRNGVRTFLTVVMSLPVPFACALVVWIMIADRVPIWRQSDIVIAALLQIAMLLSIFRFRREV